MKLAPVLAKYLTTHKNLSLPGLGTFKAETAYNPELDYSKKGESLLNISFEQEKIIKPDEDLINFIATEKGKMKVLAESDLMSELEGALTFLNTGKPYFFTGIGTLTKKRDGSFEFHQEKYSRDVDGERKKKLPITEQNAVPPSYIDETRKPRKTKPAIIILTLCIIAIAATVWFYKKNSDKAMAGIEDVTEMTEAPKTNVASEKTELPATPVATAAPASYKYILEIARQPRASKRYNQLKKINWPVEIESSDSINYTLFMQLPAVNADTTRIKDSLSALSGRKVWIAK